MEEISLNEAMKRLPERERHIIDMRFFEGKTQTEVAEEIHISQAQVSRLEKNALKAMRKLSELSQTQTDAGRNPSDPRGFPVNKPAGEIPCTQIPPPAPQPQQ